MIEHRHSSALGIAGKNRSLNDAFLISEDEGTVFNWESSTGKYPGPLARSLAYIRNITSRIKLYSMREKMMCDEFSNISESTRSQIRQLTRETACKASFVYLFLDPDITSDLPMMFHESEQDLWRRFIKAIFYIGKGTRSRPLQHLNAANKTFGKASRKKEVTEKISKIHKIWENGGGVVVLQVFQNTIAVEAHTREALMIEAMGCDNLTNLNTGDLKGVARGWGKDSRLELGTFLLYKAFKIFLIEGERQIRPADVTFS